jgi:hypothetical protein
MGQPQQVPAFSDTTLAMWHAQEMEEERKAFEQKIRQNRIRELERAFVDVRHGMPDATDNEHAALAFAARWGHLRHLLGKYPDLVVRTLDQIKVEAHTPKAYALRFVMTALVNEADAAALLLASWQASKRRHSEVLYWLTGGLETEMTSTGPKTSQPSAQHGPPQAELQEQPDVANTAAGRSSAISGPPAPVSDSVEWTTADSPSRWAKMFNVSPSTFKRWLDDGGIRHIKRSAKSYQIAIADLPAKYQAKFRSAENPTTATPR